MQIHHDEPYACAVRSQVNECVFVSARMPYLFSLMVNGHWVLLGLSFGVHAECWPTLGRHGSRKGVHPGRPGSKGEAASFTPFCARSTCSESNGESKMAKNAQSCRSPSRLFSKSRMPGNAVHLRCVTLGDPEPPGPALQLPRQWGRRAPPNFHGLDMTGSKGCQHRQCSGHRGGRSSTCEQRGSSPITHDSMSGDHRLGTNKACDFLSKV